MPARRQGTGRGGSLRTAAVLLAVVVLASLLNAVVAAVARAAGASGDFQPLQAFAYVSFTLFGVVLGAVGWVVIRRVAKDAQALLRWLVPVIVAVSLVPDLAMLGSDYKPHANGAGVVALMVMHVVVAVVAVIGYRRVFPVGARAA